MAEHKKWKSAVRNMNYSVAAHSGALAPVWIIKYAGAAYRDGKITLGERDKMFADARYAMCGGQR